MVLWTIYIQSYQDLLDIEIEIDNEKTFGELKKIVSEKMNIPYNDLLLVGKEEYGAKYNRIKLKEINGLCDQMTFIAAYQAGGGGGSWYNKEIHIKFLRQSKNIINSDESSDISGLLKLCFLKEIAPKISDNNLKKLSELLYHIIEILLKGYVSDFREDIQKNIVEVLEKMRGSNIINFSNFVDEVIDSYQIKQLLNFLPNSYLNEMKDIKYRLSKYNNCIELFNKEFRKSVKESILEFSVISLVIIEREDFEIFERERNKCSNRVERILYHGTSIDPISKILTGLYKKSLERKKAINGNGVYFTDLLDYAWFYGGEDGNRANCTRIPKVGDTFTAIVNWVYYDKNGFYQVKDRNSVRNPGKNQINFAYAGSVTERLQNIDKSKFFATEFVVYELDQICPFMSMKLKREEFCVIWRDNNFSSNPVYNNEYDKIFKEFLKERMKYINQNAKFNIYPCETSEEALELVKRKKYNKIILLSNVGSDLGGKKFIEKAREIIGNDVIALFLAYSTSHLKWIKSFKNALFANQPTFYEDYLQCFDENNNDDIQRELKKLVNKMEEHYKVKFNFDDNYLHYPLFKDSGKYSDMSF